ncbi:uncharacterized protein LOC121383951 [Gigantopelta aegis]|uniref:uncharacterized protein LOC121383951 n=1 Tax=Gigantopelta aegis TaxID=1735272 RepID=UPI001B88A792|nr:uncharacterized protein LOC121383951 [Gigantopelta aegis]
MASGHSSSTTQCPEQGERSRCQLEIGQNVYVVAQPWKQELLIHIRKFDSDKGKTFPTKQGIALNLKQWVELCGCKSQIDETISALKQGKDETLVKHLGANVHASMDKNFTGVDLRQWWWCDEMKSVKPSKKGIFLSLQQWEKLKGCFTVMCDFVPELNSSVPCAMQDDHQNQMGFLQCSFCTPNGYHQ